MKWLTWEKTQNIYGKTVEKKSEFGRENSVNGSIDVEKVNEMRHSGGVVVTSGTEVRVIWRG